MFWNHNNLNQVTVPLAVLDAMAAEWCLVTSSTDDTKQDRRLNIYLANEENDAVWRTRCKLDNRAS